MNYKYIFENGLKNNVHLDVVLNACLVSAKIRPAFLLESADYFKKSTFDKKSYLRNIKWVVDNFPNFKQKNLDENILFYITDIEKIKNRLQHKNLGKLLGFQCPGQMNGAFIINITCETSDGSEIYLMSERCNSYTKSLDNKLKLFVTNINEFCKSENLDIITNYSVMEIPSDALANDIISGKKTLNNMEAGWLANEVANWGFERLADYIDSITITGQDLEVQPQWVKCLKFIADNKFNISDFPTTKEFEEHHRNYSKQAKALEKRWLPPNYATNPDDLWYI